MPGREQGRSLLLPVSVAPAVGFKGSQWELQGSQRLGETPIANPFRTFRRTSLPPNVSFNASCNGLSKCKSSLGMAGPVQIQHRVDHH